jgi:RND family efflux transporter MFP subunit
MMDDKHKSGLLDSLKIDRAPPPKKSSGPLSLWVIVLAVILVAGGGAAAWFFWPDSRIAVHAVTAQAEGGASGGTGLDASGYVVARRKATLSAKILGKLVQLNFEEGQRVKQGDIVARLDDSNYAAALREAEAQELQAKAAFDNASAFYTRYQRLRDQGAISADAVENQRIAYDTARTGYAVSQAGVEFARANENDTTVRAPFDGVVTVKVAQVGEVVAPSAAGGGDTRTGIVTIVDMDSLEVLVDVAENYIERVEVGGQVVIHLDAYPDLDIPGSVIAVIPTADQSKGTVEVRVAIKAKDSRILPQMAARVSFLTAPQAGAPAATRVSVPLQAVLGSGRSGSVFLIGENGAVEKRDVALGLKTAQSVAILSGISAGDRVVSGGLDKLHDGDKVKIQE